MFHKLFEYYFIIYLNKIYRTKKMNSKIHQILILVIPLNLVNKSDTSVG